MNLQSLTTAQVVSAYSGKIGCACGCKGKYSYTALNRDLGSQNRGYSVGDDEINEKQVKRILSLLQQNAQTCVEDGNLAYVEADTRLYMIRTIESITK